MTVFGIISLALLILIQVQESPRLSKTAIALAIVGFIVGVSLLIYFFRRYKRTEKELQDEWERPEQSLFAPSKPSVERGEGRSLSEAEQTISTGAPEEELVPESIADTEPSLILATEASPLSAATAPLTQELQSDGSVVTEHLTQELQSDGVAPDYAFVLDTETTRGKTEDLSSEKNEVPSMESEVAPPTLVSAQSPEIARHPTKVLSSEKQSERTEGDVESILLDEDIWAGLDLTPHDVPAITQSLGRKQAPDGSSNQPETAKPPSQTELLGAIRIDSDLLHERFESAPPENRTRILASSPPESKQNDVIDTVTDAGASPAEGSMVAPAGAANSAAAIRVRAGSVLGLPAERSHAPLVLGAPVKQRDEIGIGALSNYGKDVEGGGGHGGTLTLAAVILLLGGGIAAYLLVPSVQSWVKAKVERTRGIDPNLAEAIEQPKARVFAARNEANKNIVKARGAVDNISEENLNNLEVEVSLERVNGAPPELRKVPVKPAQLAPKERGVFEFEYDGNRATGFGGYRIVRLLSGESEIKYATPGRTG